MFQSAKMINFNLYSIKATFYLISITCLFAASTLTQLTPQNTDCNANNCSSCLSLNGSVYLRCNETFCHCGDVNATEEFCQGSNLNQVKTIKSSDLCEAEFSSSVNATSANGTSDSTSTEAANSTLTPNTSSEAVPVETITTPTPTTTPVTPTTTATPVPTEAAVVTAATNATDVSTKATEETTKAAASTPQPVVEAGRRFDGASFIGGMILALGLMAISYVGFKFYRSRTENNYHTLREAIHM